MLLAFDQVYMLGYNLEKKTFKDEQAKAKF